MLGTRDLRQGIAIDLESYRVPTPSITVSWFPTAWFQWDVGCTPFFTPDRFDVAGTNEALIGPNVPFVHQLAASLRPQVSAATYNDLMNALGRVNAPDARPQNGEVATRVAARFAGLDIGATAGLLRAKVPLVDVAPALEQELVGGGQRGLVDVARALQAGDRLLLADYDRYGQLALDIETAAGPFALAAEAGYTPSRELPTVTPSTVLPGISHSALEQVAVKMTYAPSLDTQVTAEAYLYRATSAPGPGTRFLFFDDDRRFIAGWGAVHKDFGSHFVEAIGLGTSSGPSLSVTARYGYHLSETATIAVGGCMYRGPSTFDWSFGSLHVDLDEVFAGLRVEW
jgi:hypothetical protein